MAAQGPDLDPWAHLQILNTIDALAARLQSDIGRDLQNMAREAIRGAAAESLGAEVTFSESGESSPKSTG